MEITARNAVSEHNIPYFELEIETDECDLSLRRYPRTTTAVVTDYRTNNGGTDIDGIFEIVSLVARTPNETFDVEDVVCKTNDTYRLWLSETDINTVISAWKKEVKRAI